LKSGLLLVEHVDFAFEILEHLINVRIRSLGNDCNIFFSTFTIALNFCGTNDIMFLLLGLVKPSQEKAGSLCLLSSVRAAQVEENVRVLTEKLLNDTDDCLPYFHITR